MAERGERSDDGSRHAAAATAFARRARNREGVTLESLILFGSAARGDASGLGSDVDFLAVVPDDADRATIEEELRDVAYDVMLEFGPVVEVHVLSRSAFEHRRDTPFVRRAVREGETYAWPGREQLRRADQALEDAQGAREADLSDAVVVNRCYYACFHAAQAVLYEGGHEPGSHGGVLSLFGSEVVVEGDASREQGRFLNDLSTLRKQADYGYEPVDKDVESLLERTAAFVEAMHALVEGS